MKKEKYKISKKVMLLTIAVLTVFTSFSGNFLNLHADFTVNVTGMNATGYTHRGQACSGYNCAQFYGQSIDKLTLSDGRVGFCIEPHLLVNGGNGYSGSEINDEALGKIVYHGYLNTGQSMYDYAVTQLMIWELKGYVPTSHTVPNYANRKAEIQNAINSHYTNLSFNNTSHTVNVNESITLTDTNNVLSQFKNWKADGCDISVNGNQLTIIPRENASDNVVLRADKYKTQYVGASYIYRKANSQAIGSYYLHDPIPFKINLKVNKYGSLNIVKKDEDGNTVPNTSFTLSYNADMSNPIGTYTTGGNGAVKIDQLLPQTVYYQEVGVPSHLVLDNTIRSITIVPNDTIEVQATNKWVVGTIQVVKKDAETGKTIVRDNTTFSVYKQDGTFIQDIVTNNQGVAKLKLRYGQYYLKEKTAPSKYTKSEETIYYNVNADGQTFSAEMKDTRTKGSIILKKVDKETSDNPQGDSIFQGAVYGLYARENILDPADNSVIYTKDTKIAERITKADGTMDSIDNLYLGKYYVKELQAPIGYELDTTEINVILSYANQNVPVVVENATSKEQVKTGSFSLEKGIANSNDSEIMKPEENAKFITVLKKYVEQYG
ncbi:MAG: hypothetical protein EOM50_20505, partial [Erysipelotrichia bacterium]|nr:hypothetical protein [Erysipelotrichia bacterium]